MHTRTLIVCLPDCHSPFDGMSAWIGLYFYLFLLPRFFIWDSAVHCDCDSTQRQFLHLHLHDGDTSFSFSPLWFKFFFCILHWVFFFVDFLANAFILCTCICIYVSGWISVGCWMGEAALYSDSDRLIDWVQISRSKIYLWFAIRNLHGPADVVKFCG